MNIASVIVDNFSKEVDTLYDYIIPEIYIDVIKKGMRVIVPFGKGNKKIEGYVIEIKKYTETNKKLKDIFDIVDEKIYLNDEMLKMIYFLKDNYNCTYCEAVKTILPSKISIKEQLSVKLNAIDLNKIPKPYIDVVNQLSPNKYINIKNLKDEHGKNISKALIYRMRNEGILSAKSEFTQGVNIKYEDFYTINDEIKAGEFLNKIDKRIKKQQEVIECIHKNGCLNSNSIVNETGCSKSAINSLCKKGLVKKIKKEVYRNPICKKYNYDKIQLNTDQIDAVNKILNSIEKSDNTVLIHGVTGSGKTEIYLKACEKLMEKGYGAIVLVPEISLTPQTLERFEGRFNNCVAILHSRLSDGERYDEWRRVENGEAKIVVGARSAVFAPVKNLKLIIIDEEHEYSYKSEMSPKYFTKEVAQFRINYNKGVLVLGSATPSLESYYDAKCGKIKLIEIMHRVENKSLPKVDIADMRDELKEGNKSILSRKLYSAIENNLKDGNQTILFLNRRGYSTFVSCRSCGYVVKCDRCDVPMTYHAAAHKLICHYCGQEKIVPTICPICRSKYIKYFGTGTEKIENEIKRFFPSSRILRMDLDTTRRKGDHERIYNEFKDHKADILIGTQMISKGMDFKDVTLVGVIAADTSLNIPDFRGSERTFQLLTQVAGRAGRGSLEGNVIIQTYNPEHYSIVYAKHQDYKCFYEKEIEIRRNLNNPPFSDIIYVLIYSENEKDLIKKVWGIGEILKKTKNKQFEILGPVPSPISKIKNNYRWQIIFKGEVKRYFKDLDNWFYNKLNGTNINYSIDINPYSII